MPFPSAIASHPRQSTLPRIPAVPDVVVSPVTVSPSHPLLLGRCSIKDADTPGDCAAGASRNALESPAAGKIKQQGGTSKVSPSLADAFKQYSDEGGSSFSFGFGFGEPRELVVGATPYPESASTQPHSWLDLDGDCGFLHLTSGCLDVHNRRARPGCRGRSEHA